MRRLLHSILERLIRTGTLSVTWPDGRSSVYGGGGGPRGAVAIDSWAVVRRLVANPALAFGEAYVDGTLRPIGCGIDEALEVALANVAEGRRPPGVMVQIALGRLGRRFVQWNPAGRARRRVSVHYDLSDQVYALFLDRDRHYSCAYFARGDETLEEAQTAKLARLAAKLLLTRPGLSVLDIGCGWGGLAMTLAEHHGARVTGITLSVAQLDYARREAARRGLGDRVRFELADYRSVHGCYDRVVSVGMFEHVGVVQYGVFWSSVARVLAPDGVALVHAIGRGDGPGVTNPWLAKYIFPGGYSPALSEVWGPVERSGLLATDLEILRLHYAETLRHWRRRFSENRTAISAIRDERFCRMFELYLAGCELTFRLTGHMVWQLQVQRRGGPVPLTRAYLQEAAARVREPAC